MTLAVNENGQSVIGVYNKGLGNIVFGTFMPEYIVEEHKDLLLLILDSIGLKPKVKTDRLRAFILRNKNDNTRRLCILNYWHRPIKETVRVEEDRIDVELAPMGWAIRRLG